MTQEKNRYIRKYVLTVLQSDPIHLFNLEFDWATGIAFDI